MKLFLDKPSLDSDTSTLIRLTVSAGWLKWKKRFLECFNNNECMEYCYLCTIIEISKRFANWLCFEKREAFDFDKDVGRMEKLSAPGRESNLRLLLDGQILWPLSYHESTISVPRLVRIKRRHTLPPQYPKFKIG